MSLRPFWHKTVDIIDIDTDTAFLKQLYAFMQSMI